MYAEPIALLADDKVLARQESQSISPNYFVATLPQRSGVQEPLKQVTNFPSPYAGIKLPTKQLLKYQRADGLELTATLWLPAGYDKSQGPLPTLMEAYPAEFKTRGGGGPGEWLALSLSADCMGLAGVPDANGLCGVGKCQHSRSWVKATHSRTIPM